MQNIRKIKSELQNENEVNTKEWAVGNSVKSFLNLNFKNDKIETVYGRKTIAGLGASIIHIVEQNIEL